MKFISIENLLIKKKRENYSRGGQKSGDGKNRISQYIFWG